MSYIAGPLGGSGGGGGGVSDVTATAPLTSSGGGTPDISLLAQNANLVLSGPATGPASAPTFRSLVVADIPDLPSSKITSGVFGVSFGGTGLSSYSVGDILYASGLSALSSLPIGAANEVLTVNGAGTAPDWRVLTSTDVGLGNVDNTSDANKPVSTAQQAALDLKAATGAFFGSGADGILNISSGTTTLDRDRHYSDVTISGTAKISTQGYRLYVSGTLDITAAPAGAIEDVTTNGGNASGTTAGSQPGALTAAELGRGNRGVVGVAGGTAAGTTGTAGGATAVALSQVPAGQGGAGGAGSGGAGGARGSAPTITARKVAYGYQPILIRGVTIASGATNGSAGGSGGGDGTAGGGSGAGGSGGGVVFVAARTISRGGSTAAGAIRALGGNGGNGGVPAAGNRGGGGGGGGGTGGYLQLVYQTLTGSTATNCLSVAGGNGGNGGNATGTGVGGNGGDGGPGGALVVVDLAAGTVTTTLGTALVAGGAASGTTGGTGATGQATVASL